MRLLSRDRDVDRRDPGAPDEPGRVDDDTLVQRRPGARTGTFRRQRGSDDAARDDAASGSRATAGQPARAADRDVARRAAPPVRRDYVHPPVHVGNILVIVGGAVLATIGMVALARSDLDGSWDHPLTTVLDVDHTPLLAATEVAAGAALVLLSLTGRRFLALAGCIALAVAAAVVAVEPGRLATQYALEKWWAWTIAGGAAFLALVLLLPSRLRPVEGAGRPVEGAGRRSDATVVI
jgi:hypothetical protein